MSDTSLAPRILVTGSAGLIGRAVCAALLRDRASVVCLDWRAPPGPLRADIRDAQRVQDAARDCTGIIHLAAVSRVVWGERDPAACWETNVEGTRNVLRAAKASPRRPFVLLASSREVYGQPDALPASEDAPCAPVNIYGRSKHAAELLVAAAQEEGLRAAVLRFSNVYGCPHDHADRVVPAFARAAAAGRPLRVDGADHLFDFTHLEDTTRGILSAAALLSAGQRLPPIHLLTGIATSLGALASLAVALAGTGSPICAAPPRTFDVARFHGDPTRARTLLGWQPRVTLREGLTRLLNDLRGVTSAEPKDLLP